MSATDIDHVRPILEWARHSETEEEFLLKINSPKFSSGIKRIKLEAFKTHLKAANGGNDVSDRRLWEFLKVFHLIGYDLDTESGGTLSLLQSLISLHSNKTPSLLWARVIDAVQIANQNAGTISLETIPEDIRTAFNTVDSSGWSSDINRLKRHGEYILGGIRTTIGGVHINQEELFAQLLDLTESSNFVLVSGERGTGKSSLIRTFFDDVGDSTPIFCLRTEDLDKPHIDNVFSSIGLKVSLDDLEAGFALVPKKYLIIESLEKLLELENIAAFTDLLHFIGRQQGWTIIATCRDYAYQPVTFNFLQPEGVNFKALALSGFNDDQVQNLCEQLEPLQKLVDNPRLKKLLKIPFFADLAHKVLEAGAEFAPKDGEKEFRAAVWRDVIAKEQVRTNGMPLKRKLTFMNIAVRRAKQMVYGVPETGFDGAAMLKLEEDNLIRRDSKKSLVSPAHDVLEDWALERYIEDAFQKHTGNTLNFFVEIGHEPAINRAFRLWLHQKIQDGVDISEFVISVLDNQDIQRYWQDETITAVLQGDNTNEFLELLKNQLLSKDGELLKRFCFILRIACQTITPIPNNPRSKESVDALFLKPYGQGWKAIICFLLNNKESLSKSLTSHLTAVLNDWASALKINEELPDTARDTGLLALHLLDGIKDSYRDDVDRKKLLSTILKTVPKIQDEFVALLESDVFIEKVPKRQHRPHYVDDFCEMAFSNIESVFLCKYNPDILIKLAHFEWFIQPVDDEEDETWNRIDVAECFGLHEHKHEFYPASGAKGPFQNLLISHSKKGLDFILDILNTAADKYAHSNLDSPMDSGDYRTGYSEPLIEQVDIPLNDEISVKQYCSDRLWLAYRGHSVVPYLLQSALMALENWLISCTESFESEEVEWLFDYILRNSNSVMPTSVLASVATGFPEKAGRAALPLLRTSELYFLDLDRTIHERGAHELNWFGMSMDPFSEHYAQERRTSALRAWRKEHLETLVFRLQFSKYRNDALDAIDLLRKSNSDEKMRFLLHRIDSRDLKPVADKENNRIIFEHEHLAPDLEEIQNKTQEIMHINNRFSALYVWARETIEYKLLEKDCCTTWRETLIEAKELFEELKTGAVSNLVGMYYGGIVTAAAVFIRDHSSELAEEDFLWCAKLIIPTLMANADTDNSLAIADATDHDGAASVATVLPILLDFTSNEDEKITVRRLIVTALTHANENVRHRAADGIRKHLWQRDPTFAQVCINGAIEYAHFEKDNENKIRQVNFLENEEKKTARTDFQNQKDQLRDQLSRGLLTPDSGEISLKSHSHWYILTPCLMIPDGSREPQHITLLSQMLAIFYEAEQEESKHNSDANDHLKIDYENLLNFSKRFAGYLFDLHKTDFADYIEILKQGCEVAPSFVNGRILHILIYAEDINQKKVCWQFLEKLSPKIQDIAIEIAQLDSNYRRQNDKRKLVRCILMADMNWQKIDFENQGIAYGKELLIDFAANAGKNPDVFGALAKLMHYFPSIFFESGLYILSKHQREEGGIRLFSGTNTSFYLERSIQRFLQLDQTGPLPRKMHESCFILLDAIVETASSRAYYLREHLIRSRKIL